MTKFLTHKLLLLLLIAASAIRFYQFFAPLGDWHAWRQADTSAVTRNFFRQGFDLLHPRFDDLSNVPSGMDNPNGYRFVEFPVYNLLQAGVFSLLQHFITIEQAGRLVSIISSLSIVVLLYLLVRKYLNTTAGYLAAAFYAFAPFSIYYGRTVLPDTTMAAAVLAGIYFFDKWAEETIKNDEQRTKKQSNTRKHMFSFLAMFFTACAFLLKPYAVFFVLPMVAIAWNTWGFSMIKKWQLWVFALVSITPFLLWRLWMSQYPEGIPANQWLLNGNGIRFRPAFFRWIGYERVTRLISGYAGVILLALGVYLAVMTRERLFFLSFLVSSLLYVVVFATGNVQHDYYQILIMPSLAIFMGIGGYAVLQYFAPKGRYIGPVLLLLIAGISFYFSWKQVKDYFNINNRQMIEVGRLVDSTVPQDAKVIALYQGDTTFLYHTNRQGWASFQNPLPEMVGKGADYLVQLDPTPGDITLYRNQYEIVASSSGYVLVKLD